MNGGYGCCVAPVVDTESEGEKTRIGTKDTFSVKNWLMFEYLELLIETAV